MPIYTVTPVPGGRQWKIESNGRDLGERFNKKRTAVDRAQELLRNNGGSVTIQDSDGRFQRRID